MSEGGTRDGAGAEVGPRGTAARRRLSTDERREQLLRVGARLFAERPYDEVAIERLAEDAGVSRGLLYHYFPTKRDFFAAVVRSEGERLRYLIRPDPTLPAAAQVDAALDGYLGYAREHAHGFRALYRAAADGDPAVREAYHANLAALERRILDSLQSGPEPSDTLRIAVRGWLALVATVCLEWLDQPELPQERVRELCARTLLSAVATER